MITGRPRSGSSKSNTDEKAILVKPEQPHVDVTLENVTVAGRRGFLLSEVSMCFKHGLVTGLVSPTERGGGEAVVDALVGHVSLQNGRICANGQPIPDNGLINYIGHVHPPDVADSLTVEQNIRFSVEMRIKSAFVHQTVLTDIMEELGLVDVKDVLVRNTDDATKLKTALAMELAMDPPIIIFELPTLAMLTILREVAGRTGKTVIVTISDLRWGLYQSLDEIVLMDRGEVAFAGSRLQVTQYFTGLGFDFKTTSVCDLLMTEVEKEEALGGQKSALANSFKAGKETYLPISSTSLNERMSLPQTRTVYPKPSTATRFLLVCKFRALSFQSGFYYFLVWAAIGGVSSALLGEMFLVQTDSSEGVQNRVGMLFFVLNIILYCNYMNVESYFRERRVFVHHRKEGYYTTNLYFVVCIGTKIMFTLFWSTLVATCLWAVGASQSFGAMSSVLGLTAFAHSCLVSLLCYSCPTLQIAESILTFIQVYMTVFSGLIINCSAFEAVNLQMVPYMSLMRWGYEWMLIVELKRDSMPCGTQYVADQGFGNVGRCQLVLECVAFVFASALYLCMVLLPGPRRKRANRLVGTMPKKKN